MAISTFAMNFISKPQMANKHRNADLHMCLYFLTYTYSSVFSDSVRVSLYQQMANRRVMYRYSPAKFYFVCLNLKKKQNRQDGLLFSHCKSDPYAN